MFPQTFVESQTAFSSVNDASPLHPLGTLAWDYDSTWKSWRLLRYVQCQGAVAAAAGSVSTLSTSFGVVTVDRDSDQVAADQFGGVFLGTVTADYYGWVCIYGVADCTTDAVVNAGESVIPHTVDKQCDTMAAGEEDHVFAVAMEDATTAAPTVACHIRLIC